jgi:guanyl-specific ribonuclease Sa
MLNVLGSDPMKRTGTGAGTGAKVILLLLSALFVLTACGAPFAGIENFSVPASTSSVAQSNTVQQAPPENFEQARLSLDKSGLYTTKEDVALYIHLYKRLPDNFISKNEARALGWQGGGLQEIAPGKCIGGDRFGNYEGLLPKKQGRTYTECDIDTLGASSRGAKRLVFSNDGLVFYTDDHYASFELLYGEEKP